MREFMQGVTEGLQHPGAGQLPFDIALAAGILGVSGFLWVMYLTSARRYLANFRKRWDAAMQEHRKHPPLIVTSMDAFGPKQPLGVSEEKLSRRKALNNWSYIGGIDELEAWLDACWTDEYGPWDEKNKIVPVHLAGEPEWGPGPIRLFAQALHEHHKISAWLHPHVETFSGVIKKDQAEVEAPISITVSAPPDGCNGPLVCDPCAAKAFWKKNCPHVEKARFIKVRYSAIDTERIGEHTVEIHQTPPVRDRRQLWALGSLRKLNYAGHWTYDFVSGKNICTRCRTSTTSHEIQNNEARCPIRFCAGD